MIYILINMIHVKRFEKKMQEVKDLRECCYRKVWCDYYFLITVHPETVQNAASFGASTMQAPVNELLL